MIQEHKINILRDSNWYIIWLSFVSLTWKLGWFYSPRDGVRRDTKGVRYLTEAFYAWHGRDVDLARAWLTQFCVISIDGPSNREQNNLEEFIRNSLFTGPLFFPEFVKIAILAKYLPVAWDTDAITQPGREWGLGWGKTKKFCTGKGRGVMGRQNGASTYYSGSIFDTKKYSYTSYRLPK